MDKNREAVVITELIHRLREAGSWCGETHIQKSAYILKELLQVPIPYDFILYKHGPFSFDLRDELTALRSDKLVTFEAKDIGASYFDTPRSQKLRSRFPKTLGKYLDKICFVANVVNKRGVTELERLSTALFVTRKSEYDGSVTGRAEILVKLKPHVPMEKAIQALKEMDQIREQAAVLLH